MVAFDVSPPLFLISIPRIRELQLAKWYSLRLSECNAIMMNTKECN
jgi:hypothetical protein